MEIDDNALVSYVVELMKMKPEPSAGEIKTSCPWFLDCLEMARISEHRDWGCSGCPWPRLKKPLHLKSLDEF